MAKKKNSTKRKTEKPTKKLQKCIDCNLKTDDYYVTSINKGKIVRCCNCHELNILRSTKFDIKFQKTEEVNHE